MFQWKILKILLNLILILISAGQRTLYFVLKLNFQKYYKYLKDLEDLQKGRQTFKQNLTVQKILRYRKGWV